MEIDIRHQYGYTKTQTKGKKDGYWIPSKNELHSSGNC